MKTLLKLTFLTIKLLFAISKAFIIFAITGSFIAKPHTTTRRIRLSNGRYAREIKIKRGNTQIGSFYTVNV